MRQVHTGAQGMLLEQPYDTGGATGRQTQRQFGSEEDSGFPQFEREGEGCGDSGSRGVAEVRD
jgi:hypothetical protein